MKKTKNKKGLASLFMIVPVMTALAVAAKMVKTRKRKRDTSASI